MHIKYFSYVNDIAVTTNALHVGRGHAAHVPFISCPDLRYLVVAGGYRAENVQDQSSLKRYGQMPKKAATVARVMLAAVWAGALPAMFPADGRL